MKHTAFFLAILILLISPKAAFTQADCSNWNTREYFEVATAQDVRACLNAGADLEARDEYGETPLHRAAWLGTTDTVNALIDGGADIEARTEYGETPLHQAAWLGSAETINILIAAEVNIEARTESNETPLHIAAWNGATENVNALIMGGANIEARSEYGVTPLHGAAQSGAVDTVIVLIAAGANIQARVENGRTPLHLAAWNGTAEIVSALLEAGSDPETLDENNSTPFDLAIGNIELHGTDVFLRLNNAQQYEGEQDVIEILEDDLTGTFSFAWLLFFLAFVAFLSGIFVYYNSRSRFMYRWFRLFSQIVGIYVIVGVIVYVMNSYTNIFLILFWSIVVMVLYFGWFDGRKKKSKGRE